MTNIILCGGSGTRLWPLSRELMPKQFIKLFDANLGANSALNSVNLAQTQQEKFTQKNKEKSLFQLCFQRNAMLCENFLVVSNEEQYFLALDQISELESRNSSENSAINSITFLLEPLPKNTAAAITLSVLSLDKDELCLVTPSDHLIKNQAGYEKIILQAAQLAKQNFIVLLGIKPDSAQTGFGYIKMNDNGDVLGFYEKPDLKSAQKYLKDGNFFFNSGIFIFKASFFLKQMQKFAPKILKACEDALKNAVKESNLIRIKREDMEKIPENSIDYALMEKADKLKLIQAEFEWSDLGSFEALYDAFDKDKTGNVIKAKTLNLDSKGNFIYSSNAKKLIATSEIENLIIIDSEDALLLVPKSRAQRVKELVSRLDAASKFRKIHPTAHRPWGSYTVLEDEKGYKLKRIEVKPGKKLSLQKHFHRNEHWIVVSGTATVTVGDEKRLLRPNESTYIKMGQIHRLANEGKIPVILIEAQVGEYLEEDDIVRLEDDFSRT